LVASGYVHYGTVIYSVGDDRRWIDLTTSSTITTDVFQFGRVTFNDDSTGGLNAGRSMVVKSFFPPTGYFELVDAMPYAIASGDEYVAEWGCDKSFDSCKVYNNQTRFRGEPHLPGMDRTLSRKG
jgi:hypothetical protein